jgi:hypothetical protein
MIDARAKRGVIIINMRAMSLISYDDGHGESKKMMKLRVQKIGARMKGEEDIGYKGTGNLAPLGIMGPGGTYELTTRPNKKSRFTDPFFSARVAYDDLRDSTEVNFEFADQRPSFNFAGYKAPIDVKDMITRVACTGIQKSATDGFRRSKHALANLCAELGSMYAAKLKQHGTKITLSLVPTKGKQESMDVEVQEFPGRPEKPIIIKTASGDVKFEMFTTNVEIRRPKPQIMVRHQNKVDFRLRNIVDVWNDYKDVFESGHIQGTIHLDFCELNTPRSGFLWSDEMADFMEAVETFVADYASVWLKTLKKKRSIHRYYEVLHQVMFSVDEFLKVHPDLIGPSLRGGVSKGHVQKKGRPAGKFSSPRRKSSEISMSEVPELNPNNKGKRGESKGKIHTGSRSDKKGSDRKIVKGQSGTMVDLVEPDPLRDGLNWRKRNRNGVIEINISHKDFKVASDKGNRALGLYKAMLIISALIESTTDKVKNLSIFNDVFENQALQYLDILASVK